MTIARRRPIRLWGVFLSAILALVLVTGTALAQGQGPGPGPQAGPQAGPPAGAGQGFIYGQTPSGRVPQNLSPEEVQLFQELQGPLRGRVSIPDATLGTLIQPQGKEWRDLWREDLKLVAAVSIPGILAALTVFFLIRGRIRIDGGPSGRTITRFGSLDRFAHWLTAFCFIILGLTGLNIAVGREVLLPVIGPEAFTAVSQAGKYAHNYLSFPFTLGVILMFVLWVRDNIPNALDLQWLAAGGGLVGKKHCHSRRFNGGQKIVFWSTILGGGAIAVTGYVLLFPFTFTDIAGQQLAHIIHAIGGVLLVALILAHIYIGSIGMQGAFAAMGSGEVDLNWARAHHDLWVEEMMGKPTAHSGGGRMLPAE